MFESFIQSLIGVNVPEYTILILLYMPLVTTIVTFSRYVLGFKSLSIFSPILLTFALYDMSRMASDDISLITGIAQGGILILSSLITALFIQTLMTEIRIHYLAKISIAISTITFVIFTLLYVAAQFHNQTFLSLSPISLITVVLVMEIFLKSYIRKDWRKSLTLILSTIGLSYIIFFILAQPATKAFVFKHPEVIFYSLIVNLIIGRWRGLRLSEFFRFKNVQLTDSYDPEEH